MRLLFSAGLLGPIVAILLACLHRWPISSFSSPPPPAFSEYSSCTPLVTRTPVAEVTLAELLASHGDLSKPVVVRGGMSGRPAERLWSPEYFLQAADDGRIPKELLVKRSATPVVRFANLRAARPYATTTTTPMTEPARVARWPRMAPFEVPFTSHNVSVGDFFAELSTPAADVRSWPYFADGLSVVHRLASDLMPLGPMCPFADLDRCDMSLWIGRGGVAAYSHYDSSHNLFWQVSGRKQFTLAAPSATRCGAGLYPSLHPLYRQVQRDVMEPDADLSGASRNLFIPLSSIPEGGTCCSLDLQEVILGPGDLLRMPAGTLHRVRSLTTPSWSVNSWWYDRATSTALEQVFQAPLPFQADWTPQQMARATAEYVAMLYHGMEGQLRAIDPAARTLPKAGAFLARELLVTRYHPLFDDTMTHARCTRLREEATMANADVDVQIVAGAPQLTLDQLRSLLPAESRGSHERSSSSEILSALRVHFRPYVARVLALYVGVDLEWRRLHIQNYVEEILWYAIDGRIDLLYPFIACVIAYEEGGGAATMA